MLRERPLGEYVLISELLLADTARLESRTSDILLMASSNWCNLSDTPVSIRLRLVWSPPNAAVQLDSASGGAASAEAALQKNGGWFGFISEAMEFVLKRLKDGLSAVHMPYSYGFTGKTDVLHL
ncbi:hypothetical protein QYF36_014772 [Acer negundo]|nr:hypothetical protein QYF36_014772 [Acer negundo]